MGTASGRLGRTRMRIVPVARAGESAAAPPGKRAPVDLIGYAWSSSRALASARTAGRLLLWPCDGAGRRSGWPVAAALPKWLVDSRRWRRSLDRLLLSRAWGGQAFDRSLAVVRSLGAGERKPTRYRRLSPLPGGRRAVLASSPPPVTPSGVLALRLRGEGAAPATRPLRRCGLLRRGCGPRTGT